MFGWAYDSEGSPTSVDVIVDGVKAGSAAAIMHRGDLLDFNGGCAGFYFSPLHYTRPDSRVIEVRFSDNGELLGNGRVELQPVKTVAPKASKLESTAKNPWDSDKAYSYQDSWLSAARYLEHINQQITGDKSKHWLEYAIEKYVLTGSTADKTCLLLGSNEGHMERLLCEKGFRGKIVASDIAAKALERAKQEAQKLGYMNVEYVCADLNKHRFADQFDFILAEGVLHHIENTEFCVQNLRNSLKPRGLLIGMEFVGAYRFQLSETQVRWINAALSVMPKKLRPFPPSSDDLMPPSPLEQTMVYYDKPTVESMLAFDPSEAVAGFKLKELIRANLTMIEEVPTAGSLVMYMTGHFPLGDANQNPFVNDWLRVLIAIEDTLNQTRILPYENMFFVAQRN